MHVNFNWTIGTHATFTYEATETGYTWCGIDPGSGRWPADWR